MADTEQPVNDPPKDEQQGDDNDNDKKDPPNVDATQHEGESVEDTVRRVLGELGVGKPGGTGPRSRIDIEAMAEQMVRDASAKLEKEKEQEALITNLAASVEDVKKKVEETPTKLRRSTKLMWGDKK